MPEDRFEQAKRQKARDDNKAREEKAMVERADSGKEFICRSCRRWKPKEDFEYQFDGATHIATRCYWCRQDKRKKTK